MNNNKTMGIVVATIVAIVVVVLGAPLLIGSTLGQGVSSSSNSSSSVSLSSSATQVVSTSLSSASQLVVEDLTVGAGLEATSGKNVTVHYTGTLTDGTKFDSSLDRNQPFTFSLGAGEVIQGWDQGVAGMKVGGKRRLTVPADLAYGPTARGSIPANATLIFEVELLNVE